MQRINEPFIIFQYDSLSYHCRLIQEGVRKYFLTGEHKVVFLPLNVVEVDLRQQTASESCGVIGWLENRANVDLLKSYQVPYLNLLESDRPSNVGLRIGFRGEGKIAVDHFRAAGMESLLFFGNESSYSHRRRLAEFEAAAREHQMCLDKILFPATEKRAYRGGEFKYDVNLIVQRNERMLDAMTRSIRPVGVFCGDDRLALNVYYLAQQSDMRIPEHLEILGVGGMERSEEGGVQAISVVQLDHKKQGFMAAQMMERYLETGSVSRPVNLSPEGVVHRATTARSGISDPLVRKALKIIDEDRAITVNELSCRLGVSRRKLGEHFLSATNMSVARMIDLERFRHAKQLLRLHNYTHEGVALMAGYRNHKQMVRSFDRFVQMSPKQFCKATMMV